MVVGKAAHDHQGRPEQGTGAVAASQDAQCSEAVGMNARLDERLRAWLAESPTDFSHAETAWAATLRENGLHFEGGRYPVSLCPLVLGTEDVERLRQECGQVLSMLEKVLALYSVDPSAIDSDYWGRHLRETVQFGKGLATLARESNLVFLEVGPGQALTTIAKRAALGHPVYASLPRAEASEEETEHLTGTLGSLWLNGVNIDWEAYNHGYDGLRVPLPTYAFDRQPYWLTPIRLASRVASEIELADCGSTAERHRAEEDSISRSQMAATSHPASAPDDSAASTIDNDCQELLRLCAECLGISCVNADDNFFRLGGDSLHAAAFISRVRRKYNVSLPLKDFLLDPTVATVHRAVMGQITGNRETSPFLDLLAEVEREPPVTATRPDTQPTTRPDSVTGKQQ